MRPKAEKFIPQVFASAVLLLLLGLSLQERDIYSPSVELGFSSPILADGSRGAVLPASCESSYEHFPGECSPPPPPPPPADGGGGGGGGGGPPPPPPPAGAGESCLERSCQGGLICDANTCKAPHGLGGPCGDGRNMCIYGLICINNRCENPAPPPCPGGVFFTPNTVTIAATSTLNAPGCGSASYSCTGNLGSGTFQDSIQFFPTQTQSCTVNGTVGTGSASVTVSTSTIRGFREVSP